MKQTKTAAVSTTLAVLLMVLLSLTVLSCGGGGGGMSEGAVGDTSGAPHGPGRDDVPAGPGGGGGGGGGGSTGTGTGSGDLLFAGLPPFFAAVSHVSLHLSTENGEPVDLDNLPPDARKDVIPALRKGASLSGSITVYLADGTSRSGSFSAVTVERNTNITFAMSYRYKLVDSEHTHAEIENSYTYSGGIDVSSVNWTKPDPTAAGEVLALRGWQSDSGLFFSAGQILTGLTGDMRLTSVYYNPPSVTLNGPSAILVTDAPVALTPVPADFPGTPSYTWTSGTPAVASVDASGLVQPAAAGTSVISVTASYTMPDGTVITRSADKEITVVDFTITGGTAVAVPDPGAASPPPAATLTASAGSIAGISYIWSSGNTSVVTVSNDGSGTCTLTPLAGGTAAVTAEVTVAGTRLQKTVTVYVLDLAVSGEDSVVRGSTLNLSAVLTGSPGGTVSYTWSSSVPAKASVTPDGANPANAVVSGIQYATATITVQADAGSVTLSRTKTITVTHNGTLDIGDLSSYLASLPANTPEEPYRLPAVTGMTTSNWSTLCTAVKNNSTKYVDLRDVALPDGILGLNNAFKDCANLKVPPAIPASVTNMQYCFYHSGIVSAPEIPANVGNLQHCFEGCGSLSGTILISSTQVTSMTLAQDCFKGVNASKIDKIVIPNGTSRRFITNAVDPMNENVPLKAKIVAAP